MLSSSLTGSGAMSLFPCPDICRGVDHLDTLLYIGAGTYEPRFHPMGSHGYARMIKPRS